MTISVEEVKKRLTALLNDENLVNEYLRIYGPTINIKNIKTIKEKHTKALRVTEEEGTGNDPIFEIHVKCPICSQDDIICYELRSKSQQITFNKFQVPYYRGTPGYKSVDYTYIYTTVCPRCLFASPDKNDFIRKSASPPYQEIKSQLTTNIVLSLQEKIGERKATMKYISDYTNFFKRPRTDEAAILSIRLAMMRASVEAWYELPYSFYKLGSYGLRIAKIIKDMDGDNKEILKESLGYFEEAFRTSNCPSEEVEMQVLYTIIALHIKMGEHKSANSYIGVFSNLKNQRSAELKQNPKLTTAVIDKWCDRAKNLWEDRNEDDLFRME